MYIQDLANSGQILIRIVKQKRVIRITNPGDDGKNGWTHEFGISYPKNQDFKVVHYGKKNL